MNTVININLAGRSYSLEEAGHAALKTYLDHAAKNLEGNPDKEEIMKDFELAVAEKCDRFISVHKNVITTDEVQSIITEMGPVEDTPHKNTDEKTEQNNDSVPPKKLYLIREGAMIGGVCNGIAAYFKIDVTLVRIIFVVLTLITHGGWILVYFLLMVFIPTATTPLEKAQAFGTISMTAQELLRKTREGYSTFRNSKEWKRWRQQLKEERKRWKYERQAYAYRPTAAQELIHSIIGLVWISFFLFVLWFGYNNIAAVHQFFDALAMAFQRLLETLVNKIGN